MATAFVEPPEECDLAEDNGTGRYCRSDCMANFCGDGYVGPGEACDDGLLAAGVRCNVTCEPASCGDGYLQANEECDEGRANDENDACLPSCVAAVCGDGYLYPVLEICDGTDLAGESCESLGYDSGVLGCTTDCQGYDTSDCDICGNGVLEPGEECDGQDFGGATCASLLGADYVGFLECLGSCIIDTATCCLDTGDTCSSDVDCCSGWCTTGGVCHEPV